MVRGRLACRLPPALLTPPPAHSYHYRDFILRDSPDAFFIMHADVCTDFPLNGEQPSFRLDGRGAGEGIRTQHVTGEMSCKHMQH